MRTNDAPSAPGGVARCACSISRRQPEIKSGRLLLLLPLLPERRDELVHQVRMRPAVAAALREGEVLLVFAVVDPCPVPWNRSACKKNAREHRIYTLFTFFFPLPDNSAGTWGDTPCMSLSWRYL